MFLKSNKISFFILARMRADKTRKNEALYRSNQTMQRTATSQWETLVHLWAFCIHKSKSNNTRTFKIYC